MPAAYLNAPDAQAHQPCHKIPYDRQTARAIARGDRHFNRGEMLKTIRMNSMSGMRAYVCPECEHWHVGQPPGFGKKIRKKPFGSM